MQNHCSGNGQCVGYNLCQCNVQWRGDSCNTADCSLLNNCSRGAGVCVQPNVCACSPGFTGHDCSQLAATCPPELNNCNEHGACIDSACRCFTGYSGLKCQVIACDDHVHNCSGNGACSEPNVCECSAAYEGLFCEKPTCASLNRCSYNGVCNPNQTCSCNPGYSGANCSLFDCDQLNGCSKAGVCIAPNVCVCDKGYDGSSCELVATANTYAPQFANASYSVRCEEYLALNALILTVNATDRDLGRSGLVKYLIQPVKDYHYFSIDSISGAVSLAAYLYTSVGSTLMFRVQAYDQGLPRQANTADVSVTVRRVRLANTCDDIVNTSVSG